MRHSCCFLSLLPALILSSPLRAGVTIITHGLNGSVDDWIIPMAERIPDYPTFPGTTFSCYEIFFVPNGAGGFNVSHQWLAGVMPSQSDSGQILIKLDWSQLANNNYSTDEVAEWIAPRLWDPLFMPDLNGRSLASWPIHLLGHSRGGSIVSELSRHLGQQGIWVDHVTTWDPHPLNNDGFDDSLFYSVVDATVTTYENVLFADNYYQLLSSFTYGEPIFGAYVRRLTNLSGGYTDFLDISGSHSDVHLWYHGTIELGTPASDTGATIASTQRQNWWTPSEQQGAQAGFLYSRIGGGDRLSFAQPANASAIRDGMNQQWDFGAGFSDNRTPLPSNLGLWPNLIQLDLFGSSSVEIESPIQLRGHYQYGQDAAQSFTLSFHLDPDLNPLNGNELPVGRVNRSGTGTESVIREDWSLPTSGLGLAAGTYRVLGVIADAVHDRFMYAPDLLTLTAAQEPPRLVLLGWSENGLGVVVQGDSGQTIRLDAASELNAWAPLATNTLTGTTWEYQDAEALAQARRFYRAVRLP